MATRKPPLESLSEEMPTRPGIRLDLHTEGLDLAKLDPAMRKMLEDMLYDLAGLIGEAVVLGERGLDSVLDGLSQAQLDMHGLRPESTTEDQAAAS